MKAWSALLAERHLEPRVLGAFLVAAAGLWAFVKLASEVSEGETHAIDAAIVAALRNPGDMASPLGPPWLAEVARDLTALGSFAVLTVVTTAAVAFLMVARHRRTALFVAVSTAAGAAATGILKNWFERPRPEFVAHDVYGATTSFPSGHATMSALVYLTLAALIVRVVPDRRLKVTVLAIAVLLSAVIGITRVYLGVHWPSDVLAGWALGAAWALGLWSIAQVSRVGEIADRN